MGVPSLLNGVYVGISKSKEVVAGKKVLTVIIGNRPIAVKHYLQWVNKFNTYNLKMSNTKQKSIIDFFYKCKWFLLVLEVSRIIKHFCPKVVQSKHYYIIKTRFDNLAYIIWYIQKRQNKNLKDTIIYHTILN